MSEKLKRILIIGVITLVSGGALWGSYWALAKFLQDRDQARSFQARPLSRQRINPNGTREVQKYTEKDLEELRKKGQLPQNQIPPPPVQPNTAASEAVQRSLRTVQEINRINEMNRRLMEQQQRMQQNQR